MNVIFKNLSVDFTGTNADFSGDSIITISPYLVRNFYADCANCEYGQDEFNDIIEGIEEDNEDYEYSELVMTNTDLQIIFLNWAMGQNETISFEYEGDNLFWLYHDFHHAIHDVTGTEIWVNGYLEAERHYQAIKLLVERNEIYHIDIEFLANHVKDFNERSKWDNNYNADDFDLVKAIELAGFYMEENMCGYCGHEDEAVELTEEQREELEDNEHTHKCVECEETGEKYMFVNDLSEVYL
jgi:hypothetical protein